MIHKIKILLAVGFVAALFLPVSCKDLLNQLPTTEMPISEFWKTEDDAVYALQGAYTHVRNLFNRDYYLDGHGEYVRTRGTSTTTNSMREGNAYNGCNFNPNDYGGGFSRYYQYVYGGVNRANFVIEGVEAMLAEANPTSQASLETIIGEARLLRALCYFRLISMWGDVPYIDKVIYSNDEVDDISRTPIATVKDKILEDLTYAFEKLPEKAADYGRMSKPAALALRGKVNLFWASWKNFGWPELKDFSQNTGEAMAAYTAAANDFRAVIDNYGLTLYMNGEPGECDELGKAEKLPNYYYLFTPIANGASEFVFYFTHGGTGTGQGEELMRDFAGRNHEGSQVWLNPRYEIADRYQSLTTGDFCEPMLRIAPNAAHDEFYTENAACNPQSYANRDYRMKSSILWDYETSVGFTSLQSTGWCPYVYMTWAATISNDPGNSNYWGNFPGFTAEDAGLITYNTDGTNSGYVFRKFVRNTPGQGRSDGDFNWPVIRLADVYLMYAEAINEVNNGPDEKAIELVNKVRYRGKLPPLAGEKTANKDEFFKAIEQERIIELFGEGHRGFDIRRWRAIERVWCPPRDPDGVWRRDTQNRDAQRYFQNYIERNYQRMYIFQIPQSERDRNPNMTQNDCWL